MPHYTTNKNGMTKYGKKTGKGGPKIKGAGTNTDGKKNSKKKHNSSY